MGTLTPLKDRIEKRKAVEADDLYRHEHDDWADGDCYRCRQVDEIIELRKQPRWIERMQQRGLPNKDMTTYLTTWRPGPDAA